MKLPIKGVWWTSLIDWPGQVVSLIFTGGCNFRCPFCYNTDLVLRPTTLPNLKEEDILAKLKERKDFIDGVVFSGGEPTLQPLEDFLTKIKKLKLKIALETNGSNPAMLKDLLKKKLLEGIFMDIKGPLEKYEEITGVKIDKEKIKESVSLIKGNYPKIAAEFRTTVVPKFIKTEDIKKIYSLTGGKVPFRLQQFQNKKTLSPSFQKIKPYSPEELEKILEEAKKYFHDVELRGI